MYLLSHIKTLLDRAESDIQFVVQIEDDVGRSEAESNIGLSLHNKSNVRPDSVQQMFIMPKAWNNLKENSISCGKKVSCSSNKYTFVRSMDQT